MAIPHNTLQNIERSKIEDQISAFLLSGGKIKEEPAFDEPKDHELSGDMKKIYSFLKVYIDANGKVPNRRRICSELSMSAKKLGQYLFALDKMGKVSCNKHGVIVGVN